MTNRVVRRRRGLLLPVALLVAFLLGSDGRARAEFVFGGFDASRSGAFSLRDGASLGQLRGAIATNFAGSSITATPTLTSSYLGGIQVLIIGSATGDFSATTALSAAEQTALLNFVKGGGGLIVEVDNDTFAGAGTAAVNNSFLSPFGLHVTGTVDFIQTANVTNPGHPVTSGPFGSVPSYQNSYPGWFDSLGTRASSLAVLAANAQPSLAVIERGSLAPGSGGVVFVSDTAFADGLFSGSANNRSLALNSIAFVASVPEPASVVMVGTGAVCLLGLVRHHRKAPRA